MTSTRVSNNSAGYTRITQHSYTPYVLFDEQPRHRLRSNGKKSVRVWQGPEAASARLDVLVELLGVYDTSATVVLEAARGVMRYRMHYYDAQIWAAARLNGIGLVLSEDFQDVQEIEGVRFADPFAEGFDLASVLATV